ncbi:MAG: cytochrome P450 [Candidatus Xenobia bacterium]
MLNLPADSPLAPQNVNNPFPMYARLRSEGNMVFDRSLQTWLVVGYHDVGNLLRHENGSNRRLERNLDAVDPELAAQFPLMRQDALPMLFSDPPEHTRMRTTVQPAFSPRSIDAMEPIVRRFAEQLIARKRDAGEMEVVHDFAHPLPAMVISHMLGIPTDHYDDYLHWSIDLSRQIGGMPYSTIAANRSYRELIDYLGGYCRTYRTEPQEGLISMLWEGQRAGRIKDEHEVIAMAAIILWAGFETTTNLISNGLYHLLRHREQFEAVRRDPSLIPAAVEEMLRYDSPIQGMYRHIVRPTEVAGRCMAVTDNVMALLGSANRDSCIFPEGDRFDITRKENKQHMAFGSGIHFCLGAALARLEGRIAMEHLLSLPNLRLVSHVVPFRSNWLIRGVRALPVLFG